MCKYAPSLTFCVQHNDYPGAGDNLTKPVFYLGFTTSGQEKKKKSEEKENTKKQQKTK